MPSFKHLQVLRYILGLSLCLLSNIACVRPVPINAGNSGVDPISDFAGVGNGVSQGAESEADDDTDDTVVVIQQNPFALQVSFTDVTVDPTGWIRVGDGVIAVGTGVGSGVQYLIPSDANSNAIDISDDMSFVSSGFAVTGKWIVLRNAAGEVFVFNVATAILTSIDPDTFAVQGGNALGAPDFRADGNFVAAIMDRDRTTDDTLIKLLELGGESPEIIALQNNPPLTSDISDETQIQLAVDGDLSQLAVQVDDQIHVYNISSPNLTPLPYDFTSFGGVSNEKPMWLDNTQLMYLARDRSPEGERLIHLANLGIAVTSPLPVSPATFDDFTLINGQFGYFAMQSDADRLANQQARSVFGRIGFNGPLVDSDAVNNGRIADDRDAGVFGFGQTLAITPNGEYRFLAGAGVEDEADLLQVSKGVSWDVFDDPGEADETKLRATSVQASNSVCAFQTGTNRNVGYMLLN